MTTASFTALWREKGLKISPKKKEYFAAFRFGDGKCTVGRGRHHRHHFGLSLSLSNAKGLNNNNNNSNNCNNRRPTQVESGGE